MTHRLFQNQMQGPMIPLQEIRLSSSGSSMKTLNVTMFPFLMISSGAQLGVIGTVSLVGADLLFWYRSRTMSVLDDCNVIHELCVTWRV